MTATSNLTALFDKHVGSQVLGFKVLFALFKNCVLSKKHHFLHHL